FGGAPVPHSFPTRRSSDLMRVAALSPGRIARLGMPGARARTVVALARAVADGRLALVPNADIEATLDTLRALPGVGEWTAQYIRSEEHTSELQSPDHLVCR